MTMTNPNPKPLAPAPGRQMRDTLLLAGLFAMVVIGLIGLAAATYSIIMLHLIPQSDAFTGNVRTDPLRIIEALTSGIAFLAAGMIVFSQGKVHGLTTGTGMWLAAAIGLCVGLGLWPVALIVTVLALIVIRALAYVEYKALETKKPEDGDG